MQSFPISLFPDAPADDRVRRAAARHRLALVDAASFDETYDLLATFFGPAGEIEPREALRAEVAAPRWHGDVGVDYQLVRVEDEAGRLVAVADGWFAFGPELILGLGSNFYTHPDHRDARVATAVDLSSRQAFVARAAARLGRRPDLPLLVAADVDPLDPRDPASLARLRLWGRCGWAVVPPAALPFALLGQSDPDRPGALLGPVPNLLMVRGAEGARLARLRRETLAALVDLLAAVALGLAPPAQVTGWAAMARTAVGAQPEDVPLLALPDRDTPADALTPLTRAALSARWHELLGYHAAMESP